MIRFFLFFLFIESIRPQQLLSNPKCNHWPDRGTCELNFIVKWYYDRYDHRCRRFFYGGCDGNENRFDSLEECSLQCHYEEPSNRDRCFQFHDPGTCNADIERWFFDQNKKQCVCSWWSGCGGNSNIYYSYNHCMLICGDYAEYGPGIDENYWGHQNKSAMSIESRNIFLNPQLPRPYSTPYSVQVPIDIEPNDNIYHPKTIRNRLGTVNISHSDDGPINYLHSLPIQTIPFFKRKQIKSDGVTIHRYDSEPKQMEEIDQSKWQIHERSPIFENGHLKRRFKMLVGKKSKNPPRMIHLKNNRDENIDYRIKVDQNEPERHVNYQNVQENHNFNQHYRISEELKNKAEETQRRIQEQIRRKHFEEWNRLRQKNSFSNSETSTTSIPTTFPSSSNQNNYHPELVNQFKSHLEEHEKLLRMKLETQFPNHIITLTPQIETVKYPDGRSVVRQRIQWTAHPKLSYQNSMKMIQTSEASENVPTEEKMKTEQIARKEATTTISPFEISRMKHKEMKRKHEEKLENQRKEAEIKREEHLKKMKEYQEKIQKERELRMKELEKYENERRKKYEEEILKRKNEMLKTTTTTTTTKSPLDDRIFIPTVTYPISYPTMIIRPIIYDANIQKSKLPAKLVAEPVEHYRPIVEQITSVPLSIEDIIAMDNERGDYEEEYDVPMDFPDTEAPPLTTTTQRPLKPTPTPTKKPSDTSRNSEFPSIVLPPARKSKLFSPISSEEYTQDIDFDPYVDFVM